jgi:hypothetical protein
VGGVGGTSLEGPPGWIVRLFVAAGAICVILGASILAYWDVKSCFASTVCGSTSAMNAGIGLFLLGAGLWVPPVVWARLRLRASRADPARQPGKAA